MPAILNASSYIWTLPSGASGSSTTNSIYVNYSDTAVSGSISVYGTNACGNGISSSLSVTVNNKAPANAGTISGLTSVCQGQNTVTYTVPSIAYATSYVWSIPSGATGNSTTNTITVNYSNTAVSSYIIVWGTNTCGADNFSSLAVTVNNSIPNNAGTITGATTVNQGQNNVTYTVPVNNYATSYVWTLPTGTIDTTAADSITINFANNTASGNLTAKGINSCGDGASSTLFINIIPKKLNITTMLQEYYSSGTGVMNQTQGIDWNTGNLSNNFAGIIVDTLSILLRETNVNDHNKPCTIDTAFYGLNIDVNGAITPIAIPATITGYHYIVIKHRNSIETWSDSVDFSTNTINYNFHTHISQFALDGGMYIDESNLAYIWGGDVNQNGNLESEDATSIYSAAISIDERVNNGYVINDVDGNGNIDSQDYGLAYSNALIGANIINPFSYQKK